MERKEGCQAWSGAASPPLAHPSLSVTAASLFNRLFVVSQGRSPLKDKPDSPLLCLSAQWCPRGMVVAGAARGPVCPSCPVRGLVVPLLRDDSS